jgi:hypothetical protein
MKKLILCMIVAVAFTGCKKENNAINPATPQNTSMNDQVRDLIKKADPGLYDRCYNEKGPIVTVKSIPGAYVILGGDVASGTCFPTNGVCFTIISISKSIQNTNGLLQFSVVNTSFNETYGDDVTADIILNSSPLPTVKQITEISTRYDNNGVATFFYK